MRYFKLCSSRSWKIIDLMKMWHSHIAAVKHGALESNDDVSLKGLLNNIMDEQRLSDIEKRELMGDAETRKMLFFCCDGSSCGLRDGPCR